MVNELFPLLFNRVARENQLNPHFIGEFDGVKALPEGAYPAIYCWIDTNVGGRVRLSFNDPLLEIFCIEESQLSGIDADDESIQQAIALFQHFSTLAFQSTLSKLMINPSRPAETLRLFGSTVEVENHVASAKKNSDKSILFILPFSVFLIAFYLGIGSLITDKSIAEMAAGLSTLLGQSSLLSSVMCLLSVVGTTFLFHWIFSATHKQASPGD